MGEICIKPMSRIIIEIKEPETARRLHQLLIDLQDGRCGLRAIATAIRTYLKNARIQSGVKRVV